MAIPKIKGTYSLDVDTVRALDGLAQRWGLSKSEALRRAIHAAARDSRSAPLDALDALQKSLRLGPGKDRAWARRVRAERRASSERAEEHSR